MEAKVVENIMGERSSESQLTVRNEYETVLSTNFYRHRVYVNGHYKGSAAPNGGELRIEVDPGTIRLKTRQFFYFSPTIEVDVLPNDSVNVTTNVDLRHKLRLFFMPWCALILNRDDSRG